MHLTPAQLQTVRAVLARHLPDGTVWAFGSRVHGRHLKPFSDLDLAVLTPLSVDQLAALRSAFTESDLPFRVDLIDMEATEHEFRRIIERDHCVIWPAATDPTPSL